MLRFSPSSRQSIIKNALIFSEVLIRKWAHHVFCHGECCVSNQMIWYGNTCSAGKWSWFRKLKFSCFQFLTQFSASPGTTIALTSVTTNIDISELIRRSHNSHKNNRMLTFVVEVHTSVIMGFLNRVVTYQITRPD